MGYTPPASQLPGVKTFVTDRSDKGLPPNSSFSQDDRYPLRPDQAQEEFRVQVLPLPPDFRKQRERDILETPPTQFQKPGTPEEDPEGRSLAVDKVRTLGIPGEEWGNPVNDQDIRSPRRRPPFVAADRQRDQRGKAKRYHQDYYRKHKTQKKQEAKRWYRRNVHSPSSERRRDKREDNPGKYERMPGGGYADPADRTEDWRDDNKSASFYYEVYNREDNADRWHDRATPPKNRTEDTTFPAPNHQDYDHTGEPGSAKVIPTFNTDLVNHQDNLEWGQRLAMVIADIESRAEGSLHERARGLPIKLKRVNRKNAILTYHVTGGSGTYTVKVKIPRKGNLRDPRKLDVWLACSCPFWQWQGPEHHAKINNYLYGKPRGTASKPVIRDPGNKHGVCKHVLAVLQEVKKMQPVRKEWGKKASRVADLHLMARRVAVRYLEQGGT